MKQDPTLRRLLAVPLLGAGSYLCVIVLLLFIVGSSFAGVWSRWSEVARSRATLGQFEGRKQASLGQYRDGSTVPVGSPFLEGATVTVAGAALLQRVTSAVTRFGGNVLSSQIDLHDTRSKHGFIAMSASCDIDQTGLQQLLYDLEARQPFLFVDQLSVQAPGNFASSGEGKLRVLLNISAQWQGDRS